MNSSRAVPSRWLFAAISSALLVACQSDPVAPSPSHVNAVAVTYCAPMAPAWVAFRDGDGDWKREAADANGSQTTFRHAFMRDRAAIASLTKIVDGQFTILRLLYGTPAELETDGDTTASDCVVVGSGKTLYGNVSGLDASQSAIVAIGPLAVTGLAPRFGLGFTVEGVPSGPQNVLAARTTNGSVSAPRIILRRTVDLPNGSLMPILDFESSEAFDAVTPTVTIQNLGADDPVNFTQLATPQGSIALATLIGARAMQSYVALPSDKLLTGELQRLRVSANDSLTRTADVYFRLPVDRTVTLGEPTARPSISAIAGDATLRLRAHFGDRSDYDKLTSVAYYQPSTRVIVVVAMTPAFAGLTGGYDLDIPDLSAVAGFDASWLPQPGIAITWTAIRSGGTLPIGRNAVPVDGATLRTSTLVGTITLP
jgi:hypothetical protein